MAIKSTDQITIVDVTDAYSVMLTSEAYTFVGNTSGAYAGLTCETEAIAFLGADPCPIVSVDANNIIIPDGISASVANSGTSKVKITFTITATVSEACEATIPVVVDGITVNKKFSFAVAKAGQKGSDGTSVTVKSASVTYQVGTSGTAKPTGTWDTSVPTVKNGQYLWTKTTVEYSDGKSTEAYSVSYKGTNGSNGTSVSIVSTAVEYQVGDSGTVTPTGSWVSDVPSVPEGKFLWTRTIVKYSNDSSTISFSVSYKGINGTDGTDGQDAITLTITSSNGTIFKNNSGSTILTAHVWKGGIEQTITDAGACGSLGVIKWYKGSNTTAVATSKTYEVKASTVLNSEVYTCQLE